MLSEKLVILEIPNVFLRLKFSSFCLVVVWIYTKQFIKGGVACQMPRKVRDLMVEITEYPHIPYWLSVREAIFLIRSTYDEKSGLGIHRMVLVFDEKYQLLGVLTLKKLLIGIEPKIS